jgi:hypothetical protein
VSALQMNRARMPDHLRYAVWGPLFDVQRAAAQWPLSDLDTRQAMALVVLQQNLAPLMQLHYALGGLVTAGSPQHAAAGRFLARAALALEGEGNQGALELRVVMQALVAHLPAHVVRRLADPGISDSYWEGVMHQLAPRAVPLAAVALTGRVVDWLRIGQLGGNENMLATLASSTVTWATAVLVGHEEVALMWSALVQELLAQLIQHADPVHTARILMDGVASRADGEPSDLSVELWYDYRVVEVAVDSRRAVTLQQPGIGMAHRHLAAHPEWVRRALALHQITAATISDLEAYALRREEALRYRLPADADVLVCPVHEHNVAEHMRYSEAQQHVAAAELLAEQQAAEEARLQAKRDKERARKKIQKLRKKEQKRE